MESFNGGKTGTKHIQDLSPREGMAQEEINNVLMEMKLADSNSNLAAKNNMPKPHEKAPTKPIPADQNDNGQDTEEEDAEIEEAVPSTNEEELGATDSINWGGQNAENNGSNNVVTGDNGYAVSGAAEPPKAKKKSKKRKKNGKEFPKIPKTVKATGFEDYYTEPILTPAEHQEEQSLYSQTKSFPDRFMLAIARYTARRKFDEARSKIFDKYMLYSGVAASVKQFQGRVDEKAPGQTAVDTAILKSKYVLRETTIDESVVDFATVARGFLTSYLLTIHEMHRPEEFKASSDIIRNFLNYLLHHDVCPEYADQIYDAKAVCDEADKQLPICAKLARDLPGSFNTACSILFGGFHYETYIEDIDQARGWSIEPGMRRDEAVNIFKAGLAALGTSEMTTTYNTQASSNTITTLTKTKGYLEITSITPPSESVLQMYAHPINTGIHPLGTVTAKHWRHIAGPFEEMHPEEVAAHKQATLDDNYDRPEYTFGVDVELLPLLTPRTKIQCVRYETSFGIWWFDNVTCVLAPMYTYLMNEPYVEWVVPRVLPYKPRSAWARAAENGEQEDGEEGEGNDGGLAVAGGVKLANNENDNGSNNVGDGEDKNRAVKGMVLKEDDVELDSDGDEMPAQFKKYEKGEDIVLTL